MIWSNTLGPSHRDYSPALLRFRQERLRQWFKPDAPLSCPACHSREFLVRRNLLTKAVHALGRLGRASRQYWLMALYKVPSSQDKGSAGV